MADTICPIPGDADIAGVGVRAAIYAQAFFAVCSTTCLDFIVQSYAPEGQSIRNIGNRGIMNISDFRSEFRKLVEDERREPRPDHSEYFALAKTLERSIFMVGFAVMVSAIIQLKNANGLTPYHTLIVLNVSLINSWTGVYLVFSRAGFHPVRLRWWKFRRTEDFLNYIPWTAHSLMLSGFAVFFWILKQSPRSSFMKYAEESAPCRPLTYFWVFGPVDSANQSLKITSVVFYVLFPVLGYHLILILQGTISNILYALIGLGCIIVMVVIFFFGVFPLVLSLLLLIRVVFRIPHINRLLPMDHPLRHHLVNSILKIMQTLSFFKSVDNYIPPGFISDLLAYSGPIIYLVVSTESIVKLNTPYVNADREDDWTYGQTLALFTVSVAIFLTGRDWWRILKEERRKWLERRNANDASGAAELGDSQQLENAAATIASEPALNAHEAPTPPVASGSRVAHMPEVDITDGFEDDDSRISLLTRRAEP